jgi:effector-binding domain-containing protein
MLMSYLTPIMARMSIHEVTQRTAQPYVGITANVTMSTIASVADRLPELFAFLAARGIEPAGAPFWRYRVIDMERELEVEAGIPVAAPVEGEGDVRAGVLPAGRYVTVTHVGHPDELMDATRDLLQWADAQGLTFDHADSPRGDAWVSRLEIYKTDPAKEPDMSKWETELAFKLAD